MQWSILGYTHEFQWHIVSLLENIHPVVEKHQVA